LGVFRFYFPAIMKIVPRAIALVVFLTYALALGVRVVPTSPTERTADPGELVVHVFRVEGEGGPYPVKIASSAGFWVLSNPPPVAPPRYLVVSERVPEDAREGVVDVLTVCVGEACASVRTRVRYRPRIALRVPKKVPFVPPFAQVKGEVANEGNGPEHVLLRLYYGQEELYLRRFELGPGEAQSFTLRLPRPGSYRLEAEALRGGRKVSRFLAAVRQKPSPNAPFSLTGQLALGYSFPSHGYAVSFSLLGPLSDFVYGEFYGGYARGGDPRFSLALTGEGWAIGALFSRQVEGRLELWEGPVRARLMAGSGGPWARADLFLSWPRQSHRLTFQARPEFSYEFGGRFWGQGTFTYFLTFLPKSDSWNLGLGYGRALGKNRLELGYEQSRVPERPLGQRAWFGLSGPWGSAGGQASFLEFRLEDWSLAASSTARALWGEDAPRASFGLEARPEGITGSLWAELSRSPHAEASLDAGWLWAQGPYLTGRAELDLPEPFSTLAAGFYWDTGGLTSYIQTEAQPPAEDARFWLGGKVAYPITGSALWGRVRWGRSINYLQFSLGIEPFKPSAKLEAEAGAPLGSGLVTLSAYYRLPEGGYGASLGARYPLRIAVPEAVAEAFGGRKQARVEGQILPDVPYPDLSGIRVMLGRYVAETNASGRFLFLVPPGEYTLRVLKDTLPPDLVLLDPELKLELHPKERRQVVVRVSVRGRLEGRVELVGEPVPGREKPRFAVEVENERGQSVLVYTDREGRFVLSGLKPGVYTVRLARAFLPAGYEPLIDEVQVRVEPGARAEVVLRLKAPEKRLFAPGEVQILEVKPEAERVPPGARPVVTAKVKGTPERLAVFWKDRLVGVLTPGKEPGRWLGRIAVPRDARGTQTFYLTAEAGGEVRRYPFMLHVDPKAPWGTIRTLPFVKPGQKGVPVRVHLLAPAQAAELWVADRRYSLKGREADWEGRFDVPEDASKRLLLRVRAELEDGQTVEVKRYLWVR